MKSKVVAILETRTGEHLAELIARRGAVPMRAPALEEVPDVDSKRWTALLDGWEARPFTMAIFQTGVGTRALFEAAEGLGSISTLMRMLDKAVVVVRGPKPLGELNSRGVRIDIRAAAPFTTDTVLDAVAGIALERGRVLVQRYGEANRKLCDALTALGAAVEEIATYRWALPADTGPLVRLIEALASSMVDAVVFTSAVQVRNLYAVAEQHESRRGACRSLECDRRRIDRTGVHGGTDGARRETRFRGQSPEAGAAGAGLVRHAGMRHAEPADSAKRDGAGVGAAWCRRSADGTRHLSPTGEVSPPGQWIRNASGIKPLRFPAILFAGAEQDGQSHRVGQFQALSDRRQDAYETALVNISSGAASPQITKGT